jgi:pyruvate,water dikinase
MPDQVVSLDRLKVGDAARFGAKAATLGEFLRRGFDVPDGFAIAADVFLVGPELGPDAKAEVLTAYRWMGSPSVAVRSSSPSEDTSQASSAGQFKTLLNVEGEEALVAAVSECAASSERAAQYLDAVGGGATTQVAVLVQRMLAPDVAGVLFTADPVTGRTGRSIIEAVRGLGEELVSGRAVPFRWTATGREITESPPGDAPLSAGQVRELIELGEKLEQALGHPQDIEWAIAGGKLRLLQSRPITTLSKPVRDVWTTSNVVENLPGVVSPMTISWLEGIEVWSRSMLKKIGVKAPDDLRLLGFRSGRAFLNFGAMYIAADWMPAGKRSDIDLFLGGRQSMPEIQTVEVSMGTRAKVMLRVLPIVAGLAWLPLAERAGSRRVVRKFRALQAADLSTPDDAELLRDLHRWWRGLLRYAAISLPYTSRAFVFWGLLKRVLDRWIGEKADDLLNRLLTGMSGIASTRPVEELWRLSRLALLEPEIAAAIRSDRPREKLAGTAFAEDLARTLRLHGYRCDRELDAAVPRLCEDDEAVFGTLRSMLDSPVELGPPALAARQRRVYEKAYRELRTLVRGPRGLVARWLLMRARGALAGRDRTKSLGSMLVAGMRIILLECGRRLEAKGELGAVDEVFLLRIEELERALRGEGLPDDIITERRKQVAGFEREAVPDVIVGDLHGELPAKQADASGNVLKGLAVSAGRVTGRARVILGKEDFGKLRRGEILVAPWTDPGWTSLFLVAGALVADVGGVLSHGSIVAREVGIPAVTNVGNGTTAIKDGQTITVDGSRGVVEL